MSLDCVESKWVCWLCCSQSENMVKVKHEKTRMKHECNFFFFQFSTSGLCSCITSGLLSVSCGCDRCLKAAGAGRGEQSYCWRDFGLFLFHLVRIKRVKCHGLIKGTDRLLAPCFLSNVCPLCSCWFFGEERKSVMKCFTPLMIQLHPQREYRLWWCSVYTAKGCKLQPNVFTQEM